MTNQTDEAESCEICGGEYVCDCPTCDGCGMLFSEYAQDAVSTTKEEFCGKECLQIVYDIADCDLDRVLAFLRDNDGQLPDGWVSRSDG